MNILTHNSCSFPPGLCLSFCKVVPFPQNPACVTGFLKGLQFVIQILDCLDVPVSVYRHVVEAKLLQNRLGADIWHSGALRCLEDTAEVWCSSPRRDAAIRWNGSFIGIIPPRLSTLTTFSPIFSSTCSTVKVLFWWQQHGSYRIANLIFF